MKLEKIESSLVGIDGRDIPKEFTEERTFTFVNAGVSAPVDRMSWLAWAKKATFLTNGSDFKIQITSRDPEVFAQYELGRYYDMAFRPINDR